MLEQRWVVIVMLGQELLIYYFIIFILNHEEWFNWYAAGNDIKYFQK